MPLLWGRTSPWGLERSLISQLKCSSSARRPFSLQANRTYDDAVDLLNTLQTHFKVLEQRWKAGIRIDETLNQQLRECLHRIGYSQRDLEKLNIVHVAGTKGKGSTCAYVDSILSQHRQSRGVPKSVGLFTSPHLIAVRERIRINSAPLSRELFAKYFFEVWDALGTSSDALHEPLQRPVYFRYLTLLSYHAFLQSQVDVAIYETGIGGEHDATNIVDRPVVTGITSLGIDHTFMLGETIDKIAWHKAGIQKPGVPSFTAQQLPEAMHVINTRAKERGVKQLQVVDIDPRLRGVKIRPDAPFQKSNASLAVALTDTVLRKLDPAFKLPADHLPQEFIKGLETVTWRGRCERKVEGNIAWHLDGAHTAESIIVAAKWFSGECIQDGTASATRVLIFNQQGHREALTLLETLHAVLSKSTLPMKFHHVIFCSSAPRPDNLVRKSDYINHVYDAVAIADLSLQKDFRRKWKELEGLGQDDGQGGKKTDLRVLPFVEDAVDFVRGLGENIVTQGGGDQVQVLITGSVHLVGRALGVLEGADAL